MWSRYSYLNPFEYVESIYFKHSICIVACNLVKQSLIKFKARNKCLHYINPFFIFLNLVPCMLKTVQFFLKFEVGVFIKIIVDILRFVAEFKSLKNNFSRFYNQARPKMRPRGRRHRPQNFKGTKNQQSTHE